MRLFALTGREKLADLVAPAAVEPEPGLGFVRGVMGRLAARGLEG